MTPDEKRDLKKVFTVQFILILGLSYCGYAIGKRTADGWWKKYPREHLIQGMKIEGRCYLYPGEHDATSYYESNSFAYDDSKPCMISPKGAEMKKIALFLLLAGSVLGCKKKEPPKVDALTYCTDAVNPHGESFTGKMRCRE